ncbi:MULTISPECIES: hypothetical protein [unclassified Fusibacter]|uniref:hypothetical protein n=1 Tax=unclassified Fusibacter TaxID=2624464 RepID=UPI0010115D63|nr:MULTISPECIES: hypothetical protein [unclassified Fusibacter]MCK8060000.1 hypothetical protein [Fusibacter sp. A2]NPE22140.1 hypothetical protein [Fusibacter sp. A1]RXV60918.1 hypothetical protein DWB64_09865 [Fusibacter sp. A1]
MSDQIKAVGPVVPLKPLQAIEPKPTKKDDPKANKPEGAAVAYTPSAPEELGSSYDKKGHVINQTKIDELKAEAEQAYSSLIEAVKSMIERQGLKYEDVLKAVAKSKETGEEVLIEVDDEMRAEAQAAIAEDGYHGVKQTSERIIEFAKTISGGNPDKYDQLVSAIKDGFDAAKEAFGGELPEISQQTYDAVMEGLDAWKNGDSVEQE